MRTYANPSIVRPDEYTAPLHRPVASANTHSAILGIQRSLGNRAALRHIAALSLTPANTVIQRDDPPDPQDGTDLNPPHKDPVTGQGGPVDTGDKSLQCGMVNGHFKCGIDVGKGDPLQTPDSLPGSGDNARPPVIDSKKQATCPDRYAWALNQCCREGTHVSDNGGTCVRDPEPEITIPPAVPEQKGDYETVPPGPDQQYG